MADERIRIIVETQGLNEALYNLQDIKKLISDVNNQKVSFLTSNETKRGLNEFASGIQKIGNSFAHAFDFTSEFATRIGGTFSQMADLFQANFIDAIEKKMVDMFVNAMGSQLQSALNRADIMNTFVPYMNLAGVSTEDAQAALNRVDLSIRGLPIGLDEAAQRLRRYQMFLGDTQYATDLTIGIQKAITAGGAPESFKTQAYYMIDRLLTAGTLSTSRQWYSLINGLGVSVQFLAEAMGVGEITAAEFAAGLANGTYSVEQFLDAIVALGNGTATSAARLDEALGIYKSTYESWMSNIGFALTRGMANVISALDETLEGSTGMKITGYMESFRDGINAMFSGVSDWVRGHAEPITRVVDAVKGLFAAIGNLNIGGIANGILNNIARFFEYLTTLVERLSGTNFGEFIAFATTLAGPIGKFLTSTAGSLPIILGVFQRFKDFDFETLIDKVLVQIKAMADVIERALRIIPDGLMGDLMAFALVWGKPLASVLRTVGGALGALGAGHLASGIQSVFGAAKSLFTFLATNPIGLVITAITTAIAGIAYSVYQAKKTHEEMLELANESLKGYSDFTEKMNQNTEAARNNTTAARENMDSLKEKADDTKELVDELLRLNEVERDSDKSLFMDTLSAEGDSLERMREIIGQLNAMYPDWNLAIDESTGHLTDNTLAILSNVDAMLAQAKIEAAQAALTTAYTDKYTLRASAITQQSNLDELREYLEALNREYERTYNNALNNPYWTPSPGLPTRERAAQDAAYNRTFADGRRLGETIEAVEAQIEAAEKALDENEKQQSSNELLITSLNEVIRADQATAASFEDLGLAAGDATADIDVATTAVENHVAALEEAKEKYQELRSAAEDAIGSVLGGWGEFNAPEGMGAGELSGGITAREAYRQSYDANLSTLERALRGSNDLNLYRFVNELLEGGIENAPEIAAAVEAYNNGTLDAMVTAWAEGQLKQEQLAKREAVLRMLVANDIEALEAAYQDEIANSRAEVERAAKENRADKLRWDVLEDDEKKKAAIRALYEGLGEERAQAILDLEEQNAWIETSNDDAVADIEETVDEIVDVYENGKKNIETLSNNIVEAVNNIGEEIRDTTDNNIVPAMNYMFSQMIDAIEDRGSTLADAMRRAMEQMHNIVMQYMTGGIWGTVSNEQLTAAGGGWGKSGGGSGRGFYRGGIVYASNGMFIPRGTDTVPAMLTPGEFVVNRRATQTIGAHILEQINRLDIPGALHSLMHRVPNLSGAAVVNNTNNSRDNHATVNQTFFNSGDDGYAYRRANRFVRALV